MKCASILVLINSQDGSIIYCKDISNAMTPEEVATALNLEDVLQKNRRVMASCGTAGTGLLEGLEWLSSFVQIYHDSSCDESDE